MSTQGGIRREELKWRRNRVNLHCSIWSTRESSIHVLHAMSYSQISNPSEEDIKDIKDAARSLPPLTEFQLRRLAQRTSRANFLRYFTVALVACGIVPIVICYGVFEYLYLATVRLSLLDGFCDKASVSASAQRFIIDVRFGGSYTYTQAKLIDVAWDLLVGQGGRLLHAWLLCRYVVSDALVWTMERSAVPYHYYINLSFSTVSLWSLWSLLRALGRRAGWRTFIQLSGWPFLSFMFSSSPPSGAPQRVISAPIFGHIEC